MRRCDQLILCTLGIICLLACSTDEVDPDSLASYIAETGFPTSDRLIACAAGGQSNFLEDSVIKNNIFFLPISGAHSFKYFETQKIEDNPDSRGHYIEKQLSLQPVFNGFLMRFERESTPIEVWCKVTFIANDSLHICNAIRIKEPVKPTEYDPTLMAVQQQDDLITLSWDDGIIKENAIYFQVLSDSDQNLITGTYTYDKFFTFYDLSNVVINVNPLDSPPKLLAGEEYTFTLMAVSLDNWVNLIANISFTKE